MFKGKSFKKLFLCAVALACFIFSINYVGAVDGSNEARLLKLEPSSGAVGDLIIIYGQNLGNACKGKGSLECQASIYFDTYELHRQNFDFQDVAWTNEKIELRIPEGVKSGEIRIYRNEIFNYGTPEAYNKILDIKGLAFTLTKKIPAKITKLSLISGRVGDSLTIYGENLRNGCFGEGGLTCGASIFFGEYEMHQQEFAIAGEVSWTDEKITLKIPQGAKTGKIRLYYNKIFNWGELNKYTEFYDIYGPVLTIISNINIPTCTDTDNTSGLGGVDGTKSIYTIGKVYGVDKNGKEYKIYDSCASKIKLNEMGCFESADGKGIVSETTVYDCPNGCNDGACISTDNKAWIRDAGIEKIGDRASDLFQNKLEIILSELKTLRDIVKEQKNEIKYLKTLTKNLKADTLKLKDAINNFITYGVDDNTKKLGEGERAAVMYSFKAAFNKLPETEAELADAIKIANGRFPSITNDQAEKEAKDQFIKIYKRIADMNNANDSAAIKVMAYGLRQKAENRNLNSEKSGINSFKGIYGYTPKSTEDWNTMQAITYSGAKRMPDADKDLLSDEMEKRLGTNPNKADTDGDGHKDGTEVNGGYDPLK